jgi:hypothetical protein
MAFVVPEDGINMIAELQTRLDEYRDRLDELRGFL